MTVSPYQHNKQYQDNQNQDNQNNIQSLTIPCQNVNVQPKPPVAQAGFPLLLGTGLLIGLLAKKRENCSNYKTREECQKNECQWKKKKCIPLSDEDKYLVKKLREKGAVGTPVCKGEECRIGPWVAVAMPKGKEPIIIHDP